MPFPPPADNIPKGLSAEGGFGLTLGRSQLSSFKLKLVAYFVLLSLIPLAATYWGFSTVADAGESRQVTLRQEAGLRAACVGAYLHGLAGDRAVRRIPVGALLASDLADFIPRALAKIRK